MITLTVTLCPLPPPPRGAVVLRHRHSCHLASSSFPSKETLETLCSNSRRIGLRLCCAPTPEPSTLQLQEEAGGEGDASDSADDSPRGCEGCGREKIESGCNGEGRIQGGIATVPGFGWWPIKAYRPCPGFVESGGRYRRRGQSMDEVVSGQSRKAASAFASETNKKSRGSRILKR